MVHYYYYLNICARARALWQAGRDQKVVCTNALLSMTQLIELAEEKTSCSHLVAIVDSRACNASKS